MTDFAGPSPSASAAGASIVIRSLEPQNWGGEYRFFIILLSFLYHQVYHQVYHFFYHWF